MGALVERVRIPLLFATAAMLGISLYYAFVRRPSRRNKIVALVSVLVAVSATAWSLWRG